MKRYTEDSQRNVSIPSLLQVLCCLRFYATGNFYVKKHFYFMNNNNNNNNIDANNLKHNLYCYFFNR